MKKLLLLIIFVFISIYLYNGCKDDAVVKKDGGETDPGILQTDEFGNILGGDTTDWCYNNPGGFSFGPAYPNPTFNISLTVKFSIPAEDTVMMYFLKSNTDTVVLYNNRSLPGYYSVTYYDSTHQFANSYRRMHIKSRVFSLGQYCRFYGDVKFEGY